MLLHKSNIMKTILIVLLFSVTIITAADNNDDVRPSETNLTNSNDDPGDGHSEIGNTNGDDDQGAGQAVNFYIAGDEDLETDPSSFQQETYIISDGVTVEAFSKYPSCWINMQEFCEMEAPQATDFAKTALSKWEMRDLSRDYDLDKYYKEFKSFLDADDILPPFFFCQLYDNDDTPTFEDGRTICQTVLSIFGASKDSALRYGFYGTVSLNAFISRDDTDILTLYRIRQVLMMKPDFIEFYMKHMISNVKLIPGMLSPLTFCKLMEESDQNY